MPPTILVQRVPVSGVPDPGAPPAVVQLLSASRLDEMAERLLGLLEPEAGALPPKIAYRLRWTDPWCVLPGASGAEDLTLAGAALSAANGTSTSVDGHCQASLLASHSSGGAVVLIAPRGRLPALPGWPTESLRPLLTVRLRELIEIAMLRDSVHHLENAERMQRALFAITEVAAAEQDRAAMLRGLHEIVGRLMYAENFYIVLLDSDQQTIEFIYFADANDQRDVELGRPEPIDSYRHSMTWHVLTGGQPLRGSLGEIERQVNGPLRCVGSEPSSWLGVPMVGGGRVRGMIAVQTYGGPIHFTAADQAVLGYVGSHILTALERRRSRAELEALVAARTDELAQANMTLLNEVHERERGERLQAALYRIAELAGKDIDTTEFCASVHAIVAGLIPARNFYIALVSDDGGTLDFPYFSDETPGVPRSRPMGNSITEYVIRRGSPLLADLSAIEALIAAGECEVKGNQALYWLGVPLIGAQRVLGAVVVQSYHPEVVYGAQDQSLLSFVSYHIASSLERRRAAVELRASHHLLEQRVEQRTRELREQIEAREAIQAQLEHQVLHDALTGLPNRGYLRDRLQRVLGRARRTSSHAFALLYLDIDRFKVINDSLGHSAGDAVLVEVARRFVACVRENDVVARLSGDEFAILLEEFDDQGTPTLVAQRVIEAMSAPIVLPDSRVQPSVSIGIALGSADTASGEELLRTADTALYRAKAAGRNRYCYFERGLELASKAELALELDLRQASPREFEPHFQAIVDLVTGRRVGYEALLRWRHPRRGLLGPGDFLGVAEESGTIESIDWHLFGKACDALHRLGPDAGFVNLNVSPRHFANEDFADRLVALIEAHGLGPGRVHIELTEGTLLRNPERVRGALQRLHARGVQTALDDFGTGYSSLSYLHEFPLHTLKIDRSFVTSLRREGGGRGEAIVSAILAMARSLRLEVVAEGIDSDAQRSRLRELGCRRGQGYLFARPEPLDILLHARQTELN